MTQPLSQARPTFLWRTTRPLLVVAASLAVGSALTVVAATPAAATPNVSVNRYSGPDLYGTAQSIAQATFPSGLGASTVTAVLATGDNFPDALDAAYLAGRLHAPILLTPTNSLSSETLSALQAIGATGVDIVGGPLAVSDSVESQLQSDGYQVDRIFGQTEYDTAAAIAELFPANFIGSLGSGGRTAIVASGENFQDAMSGGPASYIGSFPILLTPYASLAPQTQSALQQLGIKQVLMLGGSLAISPMVNQQIQSMGISIVQEAGADATQTATDLASLEITPIAQGGMGFPGSTVELARGDFFSDGLAGGPQGGQDLAPMLLTEDPNTLGSYTTSWLQANASTVGTINVLGGTLAIASSTATAAQSAATT